MKKPSNKTLLVRHKYGAVLCCHCRAESADLKILIADSNGCLDANTDLQSLTKQLLSYRDSRSNTQEFVEFSTDVFDS